MPIDGGSGPQPHPSFIEVFREAAVDDGKGTVERAGEDVAKVIDATALSCPWVRP